MAADAGLVRPCGRSDWGGSHVTRTCEQICGSGRFSTDLFRGTDVARVEQRQRRWRGNLVYSYSPVICVAVSVGAQVEEAKGQRANASVDAAASRRSGEGTAPASHTRGVAGGSMRSAVANQGHPLHLSRRTSSAFTLNVANSVWRGVVTSVAFVERSGDAAPFVIPSVHRGARSAPVSFHSKPLLPPTRRFT